MKILEAYKNYVGWCKSINSHPIGFVEWKQLKNS